MFGLDEVDGHRIAPAEWIYQVQLANGSTTVFEEVVVVYLRKSIVGSVLLSTLVLPPGYYTPFNLCQCADLEGYVIGLFWRNSAGELLSGNYPGQGYLTPGSCEENPVMYEIPPDFDSIYV